MVVAVHDRVVDEELGGVVEGVDAVAEAFARANVWLARAHRGLATLSADDVWIDTASVSTTAWLRSRVGLSRNDAVRAVRVAHLVGVAPPLAEAWQAGDLSAGQVGAIRANVDDAVERLFVADAASLVAQVAPLSVRDTARVMQAWKARADAAVARPEPVDRVGVLHHRQQLDGTWQLDGTLGLEAGAVVDHALRLAGERADGFGDGVRGPAERRAEALLEVCQRFLDGSTGGEPPPGRRRRRPHVHVVVDAATLVEGGPGRLVGAGVLSRSATERLACDAQLHRLVLGSDSEVLDHGRATRVVPNALWDALVLRDGGCRHPGCDRPPGWCDAHHVVPFGRGGATGLQNLVLACRRHHTLVHQPGWRLRLTPDGALHVTDPQGRTRSTRPPGTGPP